MGAKIFELAKGYLNYNSVKFVTIVNWKLGLIHYLIQLLILIYIIVWAIIINKGYLAYDNLIGSATIKVKGSTYFNDTSDGNIEIWDSYDVVHPAVEPNALFLTTNYDLTPNQTRGVCLGNDPKTEACNATSPCGFMKETANGMSNGTCDEESGWCWIYAWCLPENPNETTHLLQDVGTFTVFVRTNIKFPRFGIVKDNVGVDATNLTWGTNIWYVHEMVTNSKQTLDTTLRTKGAIFAVIVQYDCDLDFGDCIPEFSWNRIDKSSNRQTFSTGFNYRYADKWTDWDENLQQFIEYRNLYKVYGLRFFFLLTGRGGKFNIVPLIVNLGSGIALLAVATLLTDIICLYFLPQKKQYKEFKYTKLDDDVALESIDDHMNEENSETEALATLDNRRSSNYGTK